MSFETTDSNQLPILTIDPEFKNLIPPLLLEERTGLEQSILNEGCRDALVTWHGVLIDGHNRYEICHNHGITFRTEEKEFDSRDDVKIWIIQNQFSRRNLSAYTRSTLALLLESFLSAQAKQRQLSGLVQYAVPQNSGERINLVEPTDKEEFNTRVESTKRLEQDSWNRHIQDQQKRRDNETGRILAKLAGVSHDTITRVKKIEEKAPEEVKVKLSTGEMSINEAYKEIRKAEKDEQLKQSKLEIEEAAIKTDVELSIHHGDCIDWLKSLPEDADLLITDPPYATDVENIEEFANSWLPVALNRVKSTGRAYVCIGAYPEELKAYLNIDPGHLELCQVLVWTYRNTLGPSPKDQYKLNWQAILYYKGIDAPELNCPIMTEQFSVQDINAPDNRHGTYERWHAWQKPDELAERLIRHSTKEGDFVIDPFAGTGTFILAATKLNRVAFGCDKNSEMIQIAHSRRGVLSEC